MKTALKIIIVILVLLAIGIGVFWFFDRQQGGEGTNFNISNYFPFGESPSVPGNNNENKVGGNNSNNNSEGNGNNTNGSNSTSTPTTFAAQFWQISENPQSGAVIFSNKEGTFVRYLDKATGNVFESNLSSNQKKRISNTTIPKVYETVWAADGNSLVLRYAGDNSDIIKSLYAKLVKAKSTSTSETETGLQELQGIFLPSNISQLVIEPGNTGKERTFHLMPDTQKGTVGFISDIDGTKQTRIFESPLHEWLVSWPKKDTLAFTTKASADVPGYMYFLNSTSGSFRKVFGGVNGLTTLTNPNATEVLYSESKGGSFSLNSYTLKTGEKKVLAKKTLPEKCVWSKKDGSKIICAIPKSISNNKYPDVWYQGIVSFDDTIWMMNASTSQTEMIVDPKEKEGVEIDAVNLILSSDEKYLLFTNKKDSQLWGLRLLEN